MQDVPTHERGFSNCTTFKQIVEVVVRFFARTMGKAWH